MTTCIRTWDKSSPPVSCVEEVARNYSTCRGVERISYTVYEGNRDALIIFPENVSRTLPACLPYFAL